MIDRPQLTLDGVETLPLDPGLSQWFTPPRLASAVADWATEDLPERARILEPSAGSGRLVSALRAHREQALITAVEIDPRWAEHLRTTFAGTTVVLGDYLEQAPPSLFYDVTAMNPPYEGGCDGLFLEKAMSESLRVVAVLRTVALNGKGRYERAWSRVHNGWTVTRLAFCVERPDYGGDQGAKADFCVVKLSRTYLGERMHQPEWWPGAWERGNAL